MKIIQKKSFEKVCDWELAVWMVGVEGSFYLLDGVVFPAIFWASLKNIDLVFF